MKEKCETVASIGMDNSYELMSCNAKHKGGEKKKKWIKQECVQEYMYGNNKFVVVKPKF